MFTDSSSEQPVAVFYDILKLPKVNRGGFFLPVNIGSKKQDLIQRHGTLFTCM